jgi:hypothetical protein
MMAVVASSRFSIGGSTCSGDNFSDLETPFSLGNEDALTIDGYHIREGAILKKYFRNEIILGSLWIISVICWALTTKKPCSKFFRSVTT